MTRIWARVLGVALIALLIVVAAACGGSTSAISKPGAAKAAAMIGSRVVIDVRTPQEYAAGHIAGARNIDVEASDFGQRIAALDRKAAYLVYCHSGRRSAIAAKAMADAGFADIVDGGGMDGLVAAGAPTQ